MARRHLEQKFFKSLGKHLARFTLKERKAMIQAGEAVVARAQGGAGRTPRSGR